MPADAANASRREFDPRAICRNHKKHGKGRLRETPSWALTSLRVALAARHDERLVEVIKGQGRAKLQRDAVQNLAQSLGRKCRGATLQRRPKLNVVARSLVVKPKLKYRRRLCRRQPAMIEHGRVARVDLPPDSMFQPLEAARFVYNLWL